jgi:hypothetical protein
MFDHLKENPKFYRGALLSFILGLLVWCLGLSTTILQIIIGNFPARQNFDELIFYLISNGIISIDKLLLFFCLINIFFFVRNATKKIIFSLILLFCWPLLTFFLLIGQLGYGFIGIFIIWSILLIFFGSLIGIMTYIENTVKKDLKILNIILGFIILLLIVVQANTIHLGNMQDKILIDEYPNGQAAVDSCYKIPEDSYLRNRCVEHMAIKYYDLNLCQNYSGKYSAGMTDCVYNVGRSTKDIKICKTLNNNHQMFLERCYDVTLGPNIDLNGGYQQCFKFDDQIIIDKCLSGFGKSENDIIICGKIADDNRRDDCYSTVLYMTGKLEDCNLFSNSSYVNGVSEKKEACIKRHTR